MRKSVHHGVDGPVAGVSEPVVYLHVALLTCLLTNMDSTAAYYPLIILSSLSGLHNLPSTQYYQLFCFGMAIGASLLYTPAGACTVTKQLKM